MKKQTVKKLVLAKETVRTLEDLHLRQAAGGATYGLTECGTICFCGSGGRPCFNSQQYTCPC